MSGKSLLLRSNLKFLNTLFFCYKITAFVPFFQTNAIDLKYVSVHLTSFSVSFENDFVLVTSFAAVMFTEASSNV